ncbi:hypothetical protein [Janthinobacterium sp. UMAB-56]|uniref:hypothetical protein n=1 Tax=Janthinobacterium sp. UMAB-56 TaxID=1365361 RepID=UPI001C562C9B|nr:hypothetical protein [Janthinobacterium sp. UMAB-56]
MNMIECILGELRRFGASDFYVQGDIPAVKLRNAVENYPVPAGETVLALVDATVFGSAKNGLAFGCQGIYWKNDWASKSAKSFLSWEAVTTLVDSMYVKSGDLFFAPDCPFNLSGSQVKPQALLALFEKIKKAALSSNHEEIGKEQRTEATDTQSGVSQSTSAASTPHSAPTKVAEKAFPGAYDPRSLQLVQEIAKRHRLPSSVYIAPSIKVHKVKVILEACGGSLDPYSILVIVDNTFLQTGKDFLIVTEKALVARGLLYKLDQFALTDIRDIRCHESEFYINNHDFQFFDQLSNSEVLILCDFLRELVPQLRQLKKSNSSAIPFLERSFEAASSFLRSELNDDADPELDEIIGHVLKVLYDFFPIIADHFDTDNYCGDDYRLHQVVLAFSLLAGYTYHHAQLNESEVLATLYVTSSVAIIESVVALGAEERIYLKRSSGYSSVFQTTFAAVASGAPFSSACRPLLDGPPEDRKAVLLAQQAATSAIELLKEHL